MGAISLQNASSNHWYQCQPLLHSWCSTHWSCCHWSLQSHLSFCSTPSPGPIHHPHHCSISSGWCMAHISMDLSATTLNTTIHPPQINLHTASMGINPYLFCILQQQQHILNQQHNIHNFNPIVELLLLFIHYSLINYTQSWVIWAVSPFQ